MAQGDNLISLNGVNFTANGKAILRNVDLDIKPGEITCLIGPNGAGKTTLVRLVLGILKPDDGAVRRIKDLRIGYVPQRIHIDQTLPMTAFRFMQLNTRADPLDIDKALSRAGVSQLGSREVAQLSGGELRRVLLARALLRKPNLLILDEPTAGLDVNGQLDFFALLEDLQQEMGAAVLFISHDLHIVMSSTNRVVCLNHHVCCSGVPENISRDPAYLELFGPAAEKLAVYHHHHNHRHTLSGESETTST